MSTKNFEEVMEGIQDTDMDAFKEVWNAAVEKCATLAHNCLEDEIAGECRDYKVD
jgi:hypothetical protein